MGEDGFIEATPGVELDELLDEFAKHIHVPVTIHFDVDSLTEEAAAQAQTFVEGCVSALNLHITQTKGHFPDVKNPEAFVGL